MPTSTTVTKKSKADELCHPLNDYSNKIVISSQSYKSSVSKSQPKSRNQRQRTKQKKIVQKPTTITCNRIKQFINSKKKRKFPNQGRFFFFFQKRNDSRFYLINITCTMGKKKEGHSSNQTIASSFSFTTLAKARAAPLHFKVTKTKDILTNCPHISLISSKIRATSRVQILSQ